ncbi:amidohydrolase family protein [Falsiroseomonas oryzae]|uniref:amidohydrolase family protein n=1 Tax=Falsiroseomonas oryzae TaxID=2766473 RepID=UPI0022EA4226|nr:amidohydrolase family protein [Roseomonas sp. MO-31]
MPLDGTRFLRGCMCCLPPRLSGSFPSAAPVLSPAGDQASITPTLATTRPDETRHAAKAVEQRSAGLVDIHHHAIPPFYLAENRERIAGSRGGQISRAWLEWTPEQTLEAMDEHGVSTAVLSLSTPGVWFGDIEAACHTARRFNEYATTLARDHAGRFGLFAAVPLPDTEGSLREIEYAFDVLRADGVGVLTSYDERWLGDRAFWPVLEELDRRAAVVFIHPTAPAACRTLLPGIPTMMAEVPQDTTRAVISLLFSGALAQFRRIKFILCHAGGSVPVVAGRMRDYAPPELAGNLPDDGIEAALRRLHYDIAVGGHRAAIAALTTLVPTSQILFGSDHPYRPLAETAATLGQTGFSEAELLAIGRENALALLPRLRPR